jgi:hypothetical protein
MTDVTPQPNPHPSPSISKGPVGLLYGQLVSAKDEAENAAEQCRRGLLQLELVNRDYLLLEQERDQLRVQAEAPQGPQSPPDGQATT